MPGQSPDGHPLAGLVLDSVRTLLWPVLIVWAFFAFQDDILEILRAREVEVAGAFKVGQRIDDLARHTESELADLERMLTALRSAPDDPERVRAVSEAATARLKALQRDVTREAAQIRTENIAPPEARPDASATPTTDPRAQAREFEAVGFERLLARDLDGAREAFAEAARRWPDYHNVSEIVQLLSNSEPERASGDDAAWARLCRSILIRYSWGMPATARAAMERAAGGRY